MRVSGRKSIRGSRHGLRGVGDDKPNAVPQPVASGSGSSMQDQRFNTNVGAVALALTEGRASVLPGGGLDPEESDTEQHVGEPSAIRPLPPASTSEETTHSRQTTSETVKGHRRRVSAVTFAHNPPVLASIAAAVTNSAAFRRARSHTAQSTSSIATTNTVMSSDMSEDGKAHTLNLTGASSERPARVGDSPRAAESRQAAQGRAEQALQSSSRTRAQDGHINDTGAYYSTAHDPDKRLSDLLFNFRPYPAHHRSHIVGSVQFEPAPLVEQDNEDDTGEDDAGTDRTDTGTEHGDDSSSNLEELGVEDEDETSSRKSGRNRRKGGGDSSGMSSNDFNFTEDNASSVGRSLSNTIATSLLDLHPLNKSSGTPSALLDVTSTAHTGPSNPSPPAVRRRERRRVNIKMGQLVGPPIIEEESASQTGEADTNPRPAVNPSKVASAISSASRTYLAASRPSLPDLRRAGKAQNRVGAVFETDKEKTPQLTSMGSPLSPARARSLTTPTPIPTIAVESESTVATPSSSNLYLGNLNSDSRPSPVVESIPYLRNRSGSGPALIRRRRNIVTPEVTTAESPKTEGPKVGTPRSTPVRIVSNPTTTPSTSHGGQIVKPSRPALTFTKVDLPLLNERSSKPPAKSFLTELLTAKSSSTSLENPFRCLYSLLASKERNSLKVTLYYPFSKEPKKPVKTSIRMDVCVEEVVGFALWSYVEEQRDPKISELKPKAEGLDLTETQAWCLRLVEDDGEVDEDFPALERTRPAGKVGSTEFAVVMATEAQGQWNSCDVRCLSLTIILLRFQPNKTPLRRVRFKDERRGYWVSRPEP